MVRCCAALPANAAHGNVERARRNALCTLGRWAMRGERPLLAPCVRGVALNATEDILPLVECRWSLLRFEM